MIFVHRKKLIRITLFALSLVILVITTNFLIKRRDPNLSILSPISKSFSILSFRSKRVPPNKIIYGYLPYWSIKDAKHLQLDKLDFFEQ